MKVFILAFVTMAFFSANSLLCRLALAETDMDAATFTAIRIVSGAIILWLFLLFKGESPLKSGSFRAAFCLFGYMLLFSWAYLLLPAAAGNLVLVAAIQISMLAQSARLGEKIRGQQWLGIGIAMIGLVVLLFPGLSAPPLMSSVLMCFGGVLWSFYTVFGKGIKDPALNTGGNFIKAIPLALMLIPFCKSAPLEGIIYAVLSGALASGFGYILWYALVPKVSVVSTGVMQLSVPIFTAIGAIFLLNEPITFRLAVSSIIILGGIVLAMLQPRKKV